jgi:hypothetical protein
MRRSPALLVIGLSLLAACRHEAPPPETVRVTRRADPQPYVPPATGEPAQSGSTLGLIASEVEDDARGAAIAFMKA